MKKVLSLTNSKGFSIIEALLSVALFSIIVLGLSGVYVFGQESSALSGNRYRATLLAQEGIEALKNIQGDDFSLLVDGTYGLAISANEWGFSGSSDTDGFFTRQIEISSLDSFTKQIQSTVTWQQTASRLGSIVLTAHLTDWRREIQVVGDWSNATTTDDIVDLDGDTNGVRIEVKGDYAYIIRKSGNVDFVTLDINGTITVEDELDLSSNLANMDIVGNYVYVVSSNDNDEVMVVDITNQTNPSLIGTYDAPDNKDGKGIYTVGSKAYFVRKNASIDEIEILDVSDPSNPIKLGGTNLSDEGKELYVKGEYAYVATKSNGNELEVVDVSDAANPIVVGSLNLSGDKDGTSIVGFGSTVVVGRKDGEVAVIDVSTPSSPSLLGTYDAGDDIYDMDLGNNNEYVFIVTKDEDASFQVIDISTPGTPSLVVSIGTGSHLHGVDYDPSRDTAYAVGDDNDQEVFIFIPQ